MQLRGAMLYVKNLRRMRDFYAGILGVQPANQEWTETWAAFDIGSVRFALHAIPAEIAANIEIASPPALRETNPVKLIFEIDDVEATRLRLESRGFQTIRRPWQKPGEAFDCVDPEGNIFQICSFMPNR